MSNLIQDSIRDGSLVLYHDYRAGHALDLSGNGNHGTIVNGGWFDRNGFNARNTGNEAIKVDHSASINLQSFTLVTLIVTKRISQRSAVATVASKWDAAGGKSWLVRLNESLLNQISIEHAGATYGYVGTRNIPGIICIGLNIDNGNVTPSYADGEFFDTAAGIPTINLTTADLYIGNYYLLSRGFGRTISSFLMWNRLLSTTEHRQAYLELLK